MTETIWLAKGSHPGCDDPERCLFEWYNHLDRGIHTGACPPGVSPVLHVYGMRLNDCLPDDKRQQLARWLPNGTSPLAGTAGDGKDQARGYIALDWIVRTYLPAWLDLVPGLATHARLLRAGAPVTCVDAARETGPVVAAARAAARAAAWAAAGGGAGPVGALAAWDAAEAAAGAAARDAAWDVLAPVTARLQNSAIALYGALIAGKWPA